MTAAAVPLTEVRLALFRLLSAAYAAPMPPDLAEALAEAAAAYGHLTAKALPPLIPPAPEGESPEFHRLFVGPGRLPAPPYESVHRGPERALMQEETMAVRAFYREHGFALRDGATEPEDHLAIELEFYARLQEQGPLEAQRRFWEEHLSKWVPAFCQQVIESSRSPFYRSLAAITREVIRTEMRVLTALLPKEESTDEGSR